MTDVSEPGGAPGSGMPRGEPFRLLFVCTGNTCRSPLAEALARRAIEERRWGHVEVLSAGIAAAPGDAASNGSLRAAERHGLDLSEHRSQPLSTELVDWADMILTMSAGQLSAVWAAGGTGKASLITDFASEGEGEESAHGGVVDPIGGDDREYEDTYRQLAGLVDDVLERLAPLVSP